MCTGPPLNFRTALHFFRTASGFPGYVGARSRYDRAASAETAAGKRRPKETTDASQGVNI